MPGVGTSPMGGDIRVGARRPRGLLMVKLKPERRKHES